MPISEAMRPESIPVKPQDLKNLPKLLDVGRDRDETDASVVALMQMQRRKREEGL